jgi:imidazolonepropionase-like amidohydrolase
MRWAKQYGVKILWGTDLFFGDDAFKNFTQEFAYRDAFFTPIEQMQQVTGINGEILGLSTWKNPYPHGPLGVIKPGAYADLILVDGDPTKDIRLLMDAENNIDLIMKDGTIYKNAL